MKSTILLAALFATAAVAHAHEGHHHGPSHAPSHMTATDPAVTSPDTAPERVTVRDCWIRSMPAQVPSGGYFVAHNSGSNPVTLTGVISPAYGETMLHQTVVQDGVARMQHTPHVDIPAGAELAFEPGGYHMMLEQPIDGLAPGQSVEITLLFGAAGRITTQCELRTPAGKRK